METTAFADDEFINYRSARALAEGYLRKFVDDPSIADVSYDDLVESFLGYIEQAEWEDAY